MNPENQQNNGNRFPVIFAGAGPGAKDLITVRALRVLQSADIVIYAGSLVNEELLNEAPHAEKFNSAMLDLQTVIKIMRQGYQNGKRVLRLHTGDPSVYGAIAEQFRELDKENIPYEVIPGVSSVFAAAAALKTELTMNDISQTVILTRFAGKTPVPELEKAADLAKHHSTMCFFLSAASLNDLAQTLIRAGRPPETPAAAVHKASWRDEQIVRGTLADIAEKCFQAGIRRQTMIIIGRVLDKSGGNSCLYSSKFSHGYRESNRFLSFFDGRTAIIPVTLQSGFMAAEIASGLKNADIYLPSHLKEQISHPSIRLRQGNMTDTIRDIWDKYDGIVFICAAGAAIRSFAPFLRNKHTDPAIVVMDELGRNVTSLLSGHTGGANRLARKIAGITGGNAVITTASDVHGLPALDDIAAVMHWEITDPERNSRFAAAILKGNPVRIYAPDNVWNTFFAPYETQFRRIPAFPDCPPDELTCIFDESCSFTEYYHKPEWNGVMFAAPPRVIVGIGCRKNAAAEDIENAVQQVLKEIHAGIPCITGIASADVKSQEPGLRVFCEKHHLDFKTFPAEILNTFDVPNPSPKAWETFGIHSVCEAAAMAAAGTRRLLLSKRKYDGITIALAAVPH